MSTLADRTARKYRGKMATGYEQKRRPQIRWRVENETVEQMLVGTPEMVLDAPVGTGRYLRFYERLRLRAFGVDVSEEMLVLARRKLRRGSSIRLELGDLRKLRFGEGQFGTVVCVRFLDLIDEDAMRASMREICRVCREVVVLTIRLGPRYVLKSNTATHDEQKFRALVRRLGFAVTNEVPVFDAGWRVMRLQRRVK